MNSWESDKQIVKGKSRRLHYNKDLNLYKRQRTFDGIHHLVHWSVIPKHIDVNKQLKCLEVGSHEGQSAMYFLKNILKHPHSELLCCDPWIKSHWLNLTPSNLCYEDVFDFNIKNNINAGSYKINKYRGKNNQLYKEDWYQSDDNTYDIIYIDDIHTYESTKLNIANGFPQLKVGGIMIFDDYDANDRPLFISMEDPEMEYTVDEKGNIWRHDGFNDKVIGQSGVPKESIIPQLQKEFKQYEFVQKTKNWKHVL